MRFWSVEGIDVRIVHVFSSGWVFCTIDTDPMAERVDKIEKSMESIQGSLKSLEGLIGMWMKPAPYCSTQSPPVQQIIPSAPQVAPVTPQATSSVTPQATSSATPQTASSVAPATPTSSKSPLSPKDLNLPSHHRRPLPIPNKHDNALSSSAIKDWKGRMTISEVIESNHKLTTVSRVSTLAVRIARDAVFGKQVMKLCTAQGGRELPGLPREELYEIKKAIFDLLPCFWKNVEEFEGVWAGCIKAIGQNCKHQRTA